MCQLSDCCCCSLRTGTLIIGILYLIGTSLSLAGLITGLVYFYAAGFDQLDYSGRDFFGYSASAVLLGYRVICFSLLALCALQFVVDILLIVGAAQRKAAYTVPWMVLNMVMLILNVMSLFSISICGFIIGPHFFYELAIAPIGVSVLYLAISIFMMSIVSSFYDRVKRLY